METSEKNVRLKDIQVSAISRNPENPRLVFRTGELEELLESIRKYGVQVPISVYEENDEFVLIDGERRWRCSKKLGRPTIPALVQGKPDALENLLLMFNIHALREQWDLLTIALKLPQIIKLLTGTLTRTPNERELSEHTGLPRATIRRCKLLIELPDHYKDDILAELRKPKSSQKLTEDFFIEMERSLKTVERAMPSVIEDKEPIRQVLIEKFRNGTIKNRVNFRKLAKMARVENVGGDKKRAEEAIKKVFVKNRVGIEEAYDSSVSQYYDERDLIKNIDRTVDALSDIELDELDEETKASLQRLWQELKRIFS